MLPLPLKLKMSPVLKLLDKTRCFSGRGHTWFFCLLHAKAPKGAITRLNPQGRVAPLGSFAWMSQKQVWCSLLTPSTSHRKVSQNPSDSGLPRTNFHLTLSGVLSPTVSTHFSSKSVQKGALFWDPLKNSPPRDFAKVWDFNKIGWNPRCFLYLWNSKCLQCFCSSIKLAVFPAHARTRTLFFCLIHAKAPKGAINSGVVVE